MAYSTARWTLDVSGGYDDQVLADPDRITGLLETGGQGFTEGATRFLFSAMDGGAANRLDLEASASVTGYGSPFEGDDTDLRVRAAYRHRFGSRLALDLSGSGWRFRRRAFSLYDMNMAQGGARLAWSPGGGLLLNAGLSQHWTAYPGRSLSMEEGTEEHRLLDLSGGAAVRIGRTFLGADLIYRQNRANTGIARYHGPVISLRARAPIAGRVSAAVRTLLSERHYDPSMLPGSAEVAGRDDRAWQFGLSLDRPIHRRASIFLDASYLDQRSSVGAYSFDQTRISVGISVDLLRGGPALNRLRLAASPPSPIRPRTTPQGIRFRFRAPQAGSVAVVGGFNAWSETAHPMSDQDRDGVWELVIPISPGIWRYAFVVDGKWVSPQDAPRYEEDGFGGRNGVIEVTVDGEEGA